MALNPAETWDSSLKVWLAPDKVWSMALAENVYDVLLKWF